MELNKNFLSLMECDIKLIYFSKFPPHKRTFYTIGVSLKMGLYFLVKQKLSFEGLNLPYWVNTLKSVSIKTFFPLLTEASQFLQDSDLDQPLYNYIHQLKVERIGFITYARVRQLYQNPTTQPFSLNERIFLSHKTIQGTVWEFLYNSASIKRVNLRETILLPFKQEYFNETLKKNIFLNAYKPLIWKMRSARYAHWNLKTRGKLNEYRYNKLLGTELYFIGKTKDYLLLPFLLFSTTTIPLSWQQIKQIITFGLFVYNGKYDWFPDQFLSGDIIELPLGFPLNSLSKNLDRTYNTFINKARSVSYTNFISRKNFGVRKPIRIPKIFKKLPLINNYLRDRFAFDPALQCFSVIHPLAASIFDIEHRLTKSSVLTLQNWRYRFD